MGSKFVGFTMEDKSDREIKEWLRDTIGWREGNDLVIFDLAPKIDYTITCFPKKKVK